MTSPSLPKIYLHFFAWALILPSVSHAQSVLERVLGEIDGATNLAQVNGTFANIAEAVLTTGVQTVNTETNLVSADPSVRIFMIDGFWVTVGDLGTVIPAAVTGFYDDVAVSADGTVSIINATDMITGDTYTVRDVTLTTPQPISDIAGFAPTLGGGEIVFSDGTSSFLANSAVGLAAGTATTERDGRGLAKLWGVIV